MDREKVISNLEQQIRWIEEIECHQFPGWLNVTNAMRDAIALLKEQEAWAKENRKHVCASCKNNADNLANGTRCPIQEHYGLPKDGFCHLWEGEERSVL